MASGTPVLPALTNNQAASKQGVVHAGTGAKIIAHDHPPVGDPNVATEFTRVQSQILDLLSSGGGVLQGAIIRVAALTVAVYPISYTLAGTDYAFNGETGLVLAANETTYIWLDGSASLQTNTTGFPADVWRIAIVTTDASDIIDRKDCRWMNADQGGVNGWSNVPAGSPVVMDGHGIQSAGYYGLQQYAIRTISPIGIVEMGENAVAWLAANTGTSDEVETIQGISTNGQTIYVTADVGDTITLKHGTDNLELAHGVDAVITHGVWVQLTMFDGVNYKEMGRSTPPFVSALTGNVDGAGYAVTDVGRFRFKPATTVTIATGAISVTSGTIIRPRTEGAAGTDDLTTLNGGTDGDEVILQFAIGGEVVTVKSGTGNILTLDNNDFALSSVIYSICLRYSSAASLWIEQWRTPRLLGDLVSGSAKVVPYTITSPVFSSLAAGVQKWRFRAPYGFNIKDFAASVATAPTTGNCIVKVLDDGVAVGGGVTAVIATGQQNAVSATIPAASGAVAGGSIIEVEVDGSGGSPNGADFLTVTINGMIALQTAPS